MSKINLKGAADYVRSLGYDVTYVAVYGSQNYGLDIDAPEYQSDVDYKCVVLPSLTGIVWQTKPVSTTVEFEGGQIDIKDIRTYMDSIVKCNVNFLETLTTEHYDTYGNVTAWSKMRLLVPQLIEEMGQSYLRCAYGMMTEKFHALDKEYPSTKHKVEKFGYDPKQLHHIVRLEDLIWRYTDSKDYGDFMVRDANDNDFMKRIKQGIGLNGKVITKKEAFEIAEWKMTNADYLRVRFTVPEKYDTKNELIRLSRELVICNCLKEC